MSLDLYFTSKTICPKCNHELGSGEKTVHEQNITHNLNAMAAEAGIYKILWRPEENGINCAGQLIDPLEKAIADMKADPARFEKHNSPNGWGMYEHFVPWLEKLLVAAKEYPGAEVKASR